MRNKLKWKLSNRDDVESLLLDLDCVKGLAIVDIVDDIMSNEKPTIIIIPALPNRRK